MEDKARYVFLKTVEKGGVYSALIADSGVLSKGQIDSIKNAFNAHAAPLMRAGILPMTAKQLKERIPVLKEQGLDKSVAAFERAIECVDAKNTANNEAAGLERRAAPRR
ncbi:MAG: hypothetical protein HY052_06175 [Proteobacteria bacterium]|nr:hypothetical protein [Pseudomonadota bacterium]